MPVEESKLIINEKCSNVPLIEKHRPRKSDVSANFLRAARSGNLEKVLEYLRNKTDINVCNANGMNALHLAAKEGHATIISELVNRGAAINSVTKKGNTALHIASLAGQKEAVETLVKLGAKINIQSQNGFSPLYMAAQENHIDIVQLLLLNNACPGLATEDGFTPLAVALQQGHDKVVQVLLENDSKGKVSLPALHMAAKKDDVKAAALLLQNEKNMAEYKANKQSKELVNDTTKSGFTPLHIASHYGNVNVAQLLIDKKADVNYKARNAITPLHVASKWGRNNMVALLLDHNANIEVTTRDGLTPLHCAARSGNSQTVDLLLERGAQVLAKTQNGLGPLHMAVQGDHVDCSRLLLYHKAHINDVTVDYLTPLHVAAHCGNVKTAKLLLERKCEVNARALNGFTPLHIACKKDRMKVVELLVRYGASIEATTESGLTGLHMVSFMGHVPIVTYLLQHGANPNTPTVRGETPLHLAARANQLEIIKILLRNAATVDAKAREEQTPLHIASRLGNAEIVSLLIDHGASVNTPTQDSTPLHLASKEGHHEVVRILLDNGASQSNTHKKCFSPLHIASRYGRVEVIELLINHGSNVNAEARNGLTPLHIATHYDQLEAAKVLLKHGAFTVATVKNGFTSLHIASKKNHFSVAESLLDYGADSNLESRNGYTPLHLASAFGHTEMVILLLGRGSSVEPHSKNGLTPLHLAAQGDHVEVAKVLVQHGCHLESKTKSGYTALLLACHFGHLNMIRYLLEKSAYVDTTTKFGYTPLHQSAQQGHIAVVNLLLKNKASPNVLAHNGHTALSIAERMGYISIVEMLKKVTELNVPVKREEGKYEVVAPEIMQESNMSDSEDETGDDAMVDSFQYLMDGHKLQDDSISIPREDRTDGADMYTFECTQSATLSHTPDKSKSSSMHQDHFFSNSGSLVYPQTLPHIKTSSVSSTNASTSPRMCNSLPPGHGISPIKPSLSEADCHIYAPPSLLSTNNRPDGQGYTSVSADNITIVKQHKLTGSMMKWRSFLVSFMVDARGGAMQGARHSGVRLIVPPNKACMPTRITCKLIKISKLSNPPPLMEGEALASRVLQMGPVGTKFLGPVVIEVPHFASLRGREREVTILRSDVGDIWREHTMQATEEAVHEALNGSFTDIGSAEELQNKRVVRILTTDFPQYFVIVTRCRQEACIVGPEGGILSSTVVPQVQAVFPPGALLKSIRVGLQVQPVNPELACRLVGNRIAISPIVTLEPRRRKFHRPITLTVPIPKPTHKGMLNQCSPDSPSLRLLCSITGGTSPSQWEDITGTTPLTFINNSVTFTTSVSARFWLMDCQGAISTAKLATDLHRETIVVPYLVRFVVFARHHTQNEARLRVVCTTEDKVDKTLENKEKFVEVARSREVEILDGKHLFIEMIGNLSPIIKSGEKLTLTFKPFVENRFQFTVRIRDLHQELFGRLAFVPESCDVRGGDVPVAPVCNLNIVLPSAVHRLKSKESADDTARMLYRISGCESLKDSLMSSSLASSSQHGQSNTSFEEKELYKNSESLFDVAWSESGSYESKEVENDVTLYDDLLTPVIEEQERSCEENGHSDRIHIIAGKSKDEQFSTRDDDDDQETPINTEGVFGTCHNITEQTICCNNSNNNNSNHKNVVDIKIVETSFESNVDTLERSSPSISIHVPITSGNLVDKPQLSQHALIGDATDNNNNNKQPSTEPQPQDQQSSPQQQSSQQQQQSSYNQRQQQLPHQAKAPAKGYVNKLQHNTKSKTIKQISDNLSGMADKHAHAHRDRKGKPKK